MIYHYFLPMYGYPFLFFKKCVFTPQFYGDIIDIHNISKIKVYNVITRYMYMLQNDYHSKVS